MPELDGIEEEERLAPKSGARCIAEEGAEKLRECPLVDALVPEGGGVDVRRNSEAVRATSVPDTASVGLIIGAEIWRPGDRLFVLKVKRVSICSGQGLHADFKLLNSLVQQHQHCTPEIPSSTRL